MHIDLNHAKEALLWYTIPLIVREREFMGRKRSASSSRWLAEHFKDQFVQKAHKQKLRSRAYFKLDEIQQTDRLFKPGMTVVDLGAAPGGWSQYAVTQIGSKGRIIACDILDMNPIVGVDFLQGDFREESAQRFVRTSWR